MPMIPSPIGVVPFLAIKVAGYAGVGAFLRRRAVEGVPVRGATDGAFPGALKIGVIRTIVGIMGGVAYAGILSGLGADVGATLLFVALAPLRMLEWATLLALLFGPKQRPPHFILLGSIVGTLASYVLDVPSFGIWWLLPGVPMC
jgi:hypothetical protein